MAFGPWQLLREPSATTGSVTMPSVVDPGVLDDGHHVDDEAVGQGYGRRAGRAPCRACSLTLPTSFVAQLGVRDLGLADEDALVVGERQHHLLGS